MLAFSYSVFRRANSLPIVDSRNTESHVQSGPYSTTPGFRWLGRTDVNVLILVSVFCMAWTFFYWLVGAFSSIFDDSAVLSVVFVALFGAAFGSWIHQVRGAHDDLRQLLVIENWDFPQDTLSRLNGSTKTNSIINLSGVIMGIGLYLFGRSIGEFSSIAESVVALVDRLVLFDGPVALALWDYLGLLLFSIIGIVLSQGIVSRYRQAGIFRELAQSIPINVLDTSKLTRIANPLIRGLIAPVVVLAASGPLLFGFDGLLIEIFILTSLPIVLFLVLLSLLSVRAVLVLHKRIQLEKAAELKIVQCFLAGDAQAMKRSRLGKLQDQFSATEVLAYRDRIEEVWDWPLQSHIPRVVFYLTIPPLAWAAAALVEQFVDAALA